MITKSCFSNILEAIYDHDNLLHKLYELDVIASESSLYRIVDKILDTVVGELEDNDDHNGPIIYDFIFKYDCGKDYGDNLYLVAIDDVKYKPKSFDELYDLLIELKNIKNK